MAMMQDPQTSVQDGKVVFPSDHCWLFTWPAYHSCDLRITRGFLKKDMDQLCSLSWVQIQAATHE